LAFQSSHQKLLLAEAGTRALIQDQHRIQNPQVGDFKGVKQTWSIGNEFKRLNTLMLSLVAMPSFVLSLLEAIPAQLNGTSRGR
jgi:hypothetical protein